MKKIAIILEDMRIGGPQKQLSYFLKELLKTKKKIATHYLFPKIQKQFYHYFLISKK